MNPLHSIRSGIGSLFNRGKTERPGAADPASPPRAERMPAAAGMPFQRPPARTAARESAAPRRAAPGSAAAPASAASPPAGSPELLRRRAAEFFKLRTVDDIDRFSAQQLRDLAAYLGNRPAVAPDVPVAANWSRLRQEFKPEELRRLIASSPAQVADFLAEPARASQAPPQDAGAQPASRVQRLLEQHPVAAIDLMTREHLALVVEQLAGAAEMLGVDADLVQNWGMLRTEFPEASDIERLMHSQPEAVARFLVDGPGPRTRGPGPAAGKPTPSQPAPFKLADAARADVRSLLAERGMSDAQMKTLRTDLREFINHGNAEMRQALATKYAGVLADDLSDSQHFAQIARNLRDL